MPSPGVNLPYPDLVPDTDSDADQMDANNDAIVSKFGNIVDGDIHADADLNANKLSQTAGKRVPATRMEDNAAPERVIADGAVTVNKIGALAVTAPKIAASAVGSDKMQVTVAEASFSAPASGDFCTGPVTGGSPAVESFAKADYDIEAIFIRDDNTSPGGYNWVAQPIVGTTGANYNFAVRAYAPDLPVTAYVGTLVVHFRKKVSS